MINHRWWLLALGACTSALGAQTRPTTFGATETRPNQLTDAERVAGWRLLFDGRTLAGWRGLGYDTVTTAHWRSEEHTSELQSQSNLVCRLLLEKKKTQRNHHSC